ncbi:hypothetical protein KI387_023711, partial [Taxus chinensis]
MKDLLHNQGVTMLVEIGTIAPCARKIVQLIILFGDREICDDFFVIELADDEIVLGIQWLQTLGEFTLNYQDKKYKFCDKDEEIRIHGKKEQHRTTVLGQQVRDLQSENSSQQRLLTLGKNIYYHEVNFEEHNGVRNTTFSHRYRAGLSQVEDDYGMENPDGCWSCKTNHFLEPSFTLENRGIKIVTITGAARCLTWKVATSLLIRHLKKMVASNGRELAIMSIREDEEIVKVLLNTLVFFDTFASCAGISKEGQLKFIWDLAMCIFLRKERKR